MITLDIHCIILTQDNVQDSKKKKTKWHYQNPQLFLHCSFPMKGIVGAEPSFSKIVPKKNKHLCSIQGHLKEKAVGLIIGMDCVLQTVDRTNVASRNVSTGTKKKIQAIIILKAYNNDLVSYEV